MTDADERDQEAPSDGESVEELERRAAGGDAEAMLELGDQAAERWESAEGERWWRQAAEHGSTEAMIRLSGREERDDIPAAKALLLKASQLGDTKAMVYLGHLIEDSGDVATALAWYERSAELGNAWGAFNAASTAEGLGDFEKAQRYYLQAAEEGDAWSFNCLGSLALYDLHDAEQARVWFEKAAEAGDTDAMRDLRDLARAAGDEETAERWQAQRRAYYAERADAGGPEEIVRAGFVAEIDGELGAARTWYTKAADLDHLKAMECLGKLEEREGNLECARVWYQRALERGSSFAGRQLRQLGD